jgi:transposase-like protein
MAETRRHDGDEFQRDAVRLVAEPGYGIAATARHLGIHPNQLGRWQREGEAKPHGACPGNGHGSPAKAEVQR